MMGDWWYIRDIRIQDVVKNMWRFPGQVMGSMDQWTEVAAFFLWMVGNGLLLDVSQNGGSPK